MIAFLRELAAAPFMLLFWGLRAVHVAAGTQFRLVKLIYALSGAVEWTQWIILFTLEYNGLEAAENLAQKLLEKHKDARISCYIGSVEFGRFQNAAAARRWIQRAEQLNCRHTESVVSLQLSLKNHFPEYDSEQFLDEVLHRPDISMDQTRLAMLYKAGRNIKKKQWDEADAILNGMLAIESEPHIHFYKWMTCAGMNLEEESQKHLALMTKALSKGDLAHWMAMGMLYLGNMEKAKAFFRQAIEHGADRDTMCFFSPELGCLAGPDSAVTEGRGHGTI